MTWTTAETPHEGDSVTGGPSSTPDWVAEPLPPGALGTEPTPPNLDDDGLFTDLPPLPLTGPLAEALHTARTGADAAADAAYYLASVGPEQRLDALRQAARTRDVLDAVLLRLTATFTPDEIRTLGAMSLTDLLLTHTGASPARASTEAKLAAALTAPPSLQPATDTAGAADPNAATPASPGQTPCPAAGSSAVTLGLLGAAHARGQVSTDIAALAMRTVADLPARIRRTHTALADATLTRLLPGKTHAQAATVCSSLAHCLDPDRADRGFDPDDVDRRYLNLTVHDDGFVDVRARLDPVVGAELKAAIEALSKPDPTVTAPLADTQEPLPGLPALDGTGGTGASGGDDAPAAPSAPAPAPGAATASETQPGVQVRDERTAAQRRADALALLVRTGRASDHTRGGDGARVIVTTTHDALHGLNGAGATGAEPAHCETTGRPLSTAALRTLACAGSLQAVVLSCSGADAQVLALGRAVRLGVPPACGGVTAGQRRAMLARDGGCLIPGCTAPPGWLEAHHVHERAGGGPSDVSNGVLLCTRHHMLVTIGVWAVRMVAGVPQVRPPRTVDPLRRWVLNPRRGLQARTTELLDLGSRSGRGGAGFRESWPAGPPDPPDPADVPDIPSPRGTCGC